LGRGFITINEFKRAFDNEGLSIRKNGVRDEDIELEGVIRRFNKDKMNGRVSLSEFLDEFTPKCPVKPY
jgi:hypothetical protein